MEKLNELLKEQLDIAFQNSAAGKLSTVIEKEHIRVSLLTLVN